MKLRKQKRYVMIVMFGSSSLPTPTRLEREIAIVWKNKNTVTKILS